MASSEQISTETESMINEFLEAMKKRDGDSEGLKEAFQVLSKKQDNAHVSADVLHRAIKIRGLNLTLEEVKETILYFKNKEKVEGQNQFNCEQFIKIVKLLEEPTVVDQLTMTRGILGREKGKKIVLYGKSGVGKTWMARKIAGWALRQGKFDVAIWVYLNRIYEGLSLQESIAYQLSLLAAFEESEAEEAKIKEESEKDKANQEEPEETKEKKKQQKIEGMIRAALKEKKLLLILDNEGSKMRLNWSQVDEKDEKKRLRLELDGERDGIDLDEILALDQLQSCDVLITRGNQPPASGDIGLMVRPLTWEESKALVFQEMDGVDKSDELKGLVDFFIGKSKRRPAEILIIAKVVSYFGTRKLGLQKLQKDKEILEKEKGLKVKDILLRGYERLPKSVLIDCYSSETPNRHFLHRGGMVNFNELISYWIIEGHLGHFDRIEDAYEEGHRVLMELIDCGLLQKQEAHYVAPSGARFNLDIHDHDEFFRKIHPGLAITFDMKLGRIALADGMMKTISSSGKEEGKRLSTLLLDGNHIGEKLSANSLSESQNELEILAIFNPTRQHFQLPILQMRKLRLLVLRGCEFLESIEHNFQWKNNQEHPKVKKSLSFPPPQISIYNPNLSPSFVPSEKLEKLTVLEISGPSSLKKIPDNLFRNMPNLRTLNMSFLQIELLPSSFYQLTKIEFLILRGCSSLRELDTLRNLKDLQLLDISGSTSFEKFHDKSLHVNDKLQILNLSQTKIKTLPLINSNRLLKFVSLSNCAVLQRIRRIDRLNSLQIFDISGATEVEEFCDPSLEYLESLVILDVSRTAIRRLPSNISNPRFLYVKDCPHLKKLPPIEDLAGVEVIDLSGSYHLEEIRKEFFDKLKVLRELNLSGTRVKHLPFLSSLGTLHRFSLAECQYLEKLEKLSSLEELEFLDLSGCKALMEMEDDSFDKMNCLQYLNLSGIQLERLPSLSKLMKLQELYVRDCPNLTELRGIDELPVLEILDHSGTILKPSPSFSNRDRCPRVLGANIDNFDHQQLFKELGASIAEVTSDHQQHEVDFTQEDLRKCKWSIVNWRGQATIDETTLGPSVYGTHFLQLLKKCPSLLTKNFSRFHFLVYPTEAEAKLPDPSSYRSELGLRDIYFEQVSLEKLERCLEIREFGNVPLFIGHLLKHAQFVVLIDNPFFKSLLDLGDDSIMAMKACWIERCDELEHVIVSEKVEDANKPEESAKSKGEPGKNFADIVKNLEILWISDGKNLRSIFNGDIESISFKSLKSLYLEYCPQISMICSSSLQLESLKILYVKYCQKLETLFTDDSAQLKNLTELHLWGLEELKRIACKVPSLRTLRVGECPLLEHVIDASTQGHEHDEVEGHGNLEILHIKFCDKLKTICESSREDDPYFQKLQELELSALPELQRIACTAPSLKCVRVGECPSLQHIFGRSNVPEHLEILEVKYCDELKTIFEEVDNINGANLLSSLRENCVIWGCPKLQGSLSGQAHVEESQIHESNDARNPSSSLN